MRAGGGGGPPGARAVAVVYVTDKGENAVVRSALPSDLTAALFSTLAAGMVSQVKAEQTAEAAEAAPAEPCACGGDCATCEHPHE